MKDRERLGSRRGFIMLSAGCAIGCGNVWKFPWMCGQFGGGGFVAVYLLCLLLLGLPLMTMEFAAGRAAQASPIRIFQKVEKPGAKWGIWVEELISEAVALYLLEELSNYWDERPFSCDDPDYRQEIENYIDDVLNEDSLLISS